MMRMSRKYASQVTNILQVVKFNILTFNDNTQKCFGAIILRLIRSPTTYVCRNAI